MRKPGVNGLHSICRREDARGSDIVVGFGTEDAALQCRRDLQDRADRAAFPPSVQRPHPSPLRRHHEIRQPTAAVRAAEPQVDQRHVALPASTRACRSASRRWRHDLHQTSTRT